MDGSAELSLKMEELHRKESRLPDNGDFSYFFRALDDDELRPKKCNSSVQEDLRPFT